ncbi:MAG: sporulation protein YqfC [Bacillota bacterium]|nr:MAG: sporulation protein YqfC [Bacillota bacterium]
MKRNQREGLKSKFIEALDLPKDVVLDIPRVTVTGKVGVLVENHRGIVEYSSEKVSVNTSVGLLIIRGEELFIKYVLSDEIFVEGKVKAFEFEE